MVTDALPTSQELTITRQTQRARYDLIWKDWRLRLPLSALDPSRRHVPSRANGTGRSACSRLTRWTLRRGKEEDEEGLLAREGSGLAARAVQ